MTDCCKSGPKTKICTRKSDKKTFTFPRRFSKKHCLTKKIKGFTMRASCAPYKDCKKGGKFDKHRNIEKDSYEDALEKPQMDFPLTDDAFFEQSSSSYDLDQNRPDVSINLDDSSLFSNLPDDDISLYGLPEDPDEILSMPMEADDYDQMFENPPSPIRRQRGGKRKTRKNKIQRGGLPAEEVRRRIMRAIHYGTPQRVRELIQSAEGDFDINDEWNGGFTLLSIAADKGRADIVKVLLQNGADPNRVAEPDFGRSSLKRAAIKGHMDVVEVLLESGANVRQLDIHHHSSIWYAINSHNYDIARRLIRTAFEQAAVNGNVYTVENAIQDRVLSIPPLKTYFYENYAIYNSDNVPNRPLPTLPPILKDEVASYVGGKTRKNKIQKAGGKWYPDEKFAKAIKDEDLEAIQDDIKSGVDINERLPDMTFKPIHVAVNTGNLDIVKLLLDNGASINMKDTFGYTPLHHAANRKKNHDSMEINAKLIDIANLLIDRGANLNVDSISDDTPLDLAARNGDLEMVELLINKGANLRYSEKALHHASEKGHLPMVKYLVEKGYPVNKIIGEILRETPLDRAVKKDHYDVVRYLVVVGGANINAVTLNRIGHFELNSPSPRLEIAKFLIRKVVKEGKGDVRLEDIKYSRPVRELYIEALNLPKLEGTKIPKEMSKFDYRGGKRKTRKNKTTKKRRKKQTRKKKRKN